MSQPIIVTHDGYDYRVPAPDGREAAAYYTDDYEDALQTLRIMWNWPDAMMEVRNVDNHPGGIQ